MVVDSKVDDSMLRVCLQNLSQDTSVDFQQVYITKAATNKQVLTFFTGWVLLQVTTSYRMCFDL